MANTPTVEEIIDDLKDHVWILICSGEINAAMVLLRSRVDDFLAAFHASQDEAEEADGEEEAEKIVDRLIEELVDTPTTILPRQLLAKAAAD